VRGLAPARSVVRALGAAVLAAPGRSARRARARAAAVRQRSALLAAVVEASEDAIIGTTRAGIITSWNPGAGRLFHYTAQEILGRPLDLLVPPDRAAESAEDLQRLRRGESSGPRETVRVRKDGRPVRVSARITPLANAAGRITGAVVIARAVPERIQAEDDRAQALREQPARAEAEAVRQRLELLARASTLLDASLDYEATLQSVARLAVPLLADWCSVSLLEDEALRLVGVAHVDPAQETLLRELAHGFGADPNEPDGVAKVLHTGQAALLGGDPEARLAALAHRAVPPERLGAVAPRSAMLVPLVARGRVLGVLALVATDSGRVYGPADLALAEDLAGRAGLAIDNARLYREVQEAIRVREEFLASASHDLKNPLAAIRVRAEVLQEVLRWEAGRASGAEAEELLDGLAKIEILTGKMERLLDELVDVARLQLGQPLKLDRRPTDLVAMARQTAAEHQRGTKRHQIRVATTEAELVGLWDAARLERVLGNLLSNAVKYTPEGGEITVEVTRQGDAAGAWAMLRVRDPGIGIPAGDLPRVFERFHRAGNAVGRMAGTGIGLAGARRIVGQHGGTIAVESREGVGSVFTVRLPLEAAPGRGETGSAGDVAEEA
jgi:PAS domain S-box-containing protein